MANFDPNKYVPVSERLAKFYVAYPSGRIVTTMLAHDDTTGLVIFKAEAYRSVDDAEASATGHASEVRGSGHVNKMSWVENCETSAVGRSLALLGFDVSRGIASREEMAKVERMEREAEMSPMVDKPASLEVIREDGQYRVGPFTVSKPNGKVICSCKRRNCSHIEAVREFVRSETEMVDVGSVDFHESFPAEPPF